MEFRSKFVADYRFVVAYIVTLIFFHVVCPIAVVQSGHLCYEGQLQSV